MPISVSVGLIYRIPLAAAKRDRLNLKDAVGDRVAQSGHEPNQDVDVVRMDVG
jgi:hypothetical protein